jgi:gliding motility-associated-like protein
MPNYCLNDSFQTFWDVLRRTKILKLINNDSLYYIFYATERWGLRYAIININADSGRGDIISNHNFINNFNLFIPQFTWPPELIKHANDTDYWLVCKPTDNEFYSYLITSQGINLSPVYSTATGAGSRNNFIKASLSGKYIFYYDLLSGYIPYNGYVCTYDKNTGHVTNVKKVFDYSDFNIGYNLGALEFSPNDSFIYVTINPNNGKYSVYQIKSYLSNPPGSALELYNVAYGSPHPKGIQLAPDGKIYLCDGINIISCITRPDESGLACNYVHNYIDVFPYDVGWGFPSVYFPLKRLKFNASTYTGTNCLMDSVRLFVQGDTTFLNYRWYFYDSTNTLIDSTDIKNPVLLLNTGAYKVKLRARNPECNGYTWWMDDIFVRNKPRIFAAIDSTKISCARQTVYIHDSITFKDSVQVNWGDGNISAWQYASGNFINSHDYYDSSKVYTITITAQNGNCKTMAVLIVKVALQPKPSARFSSNNSSKTFPIKGCTPLSINLTDSSKNRDSVWYTIKNTSGTQYQLSTVNYQLNDTGWFDITQYTSTNDGCIDSSIVNNAAYVAPGPTIQILKDSTYKTCFQNNLRLKINASYSDSIIITWGDGNTDHLAGMLNGSLTDTITHYYTNPGNYTIMVTGGNKYCAEVAITTHIVRPPLQLITSNDTTICKGTFANIWAMGLGADSMFTYILKTPSVILQNALGMFSVLPDSTTTYTIGAINACAKDTLWKQITVTLRPPLALQLNTTDTTLCKGNIFTIKATATGGDGNYIYILKKNNANQQSNSTGNFNITITNNELYAIVVTDNCTMINDSLTCNIKTYNTLQFTQTTPNVYLCDGETATLKTSTNNGSGVVSYLWYDAAGNTLSTSDSLQITPTTTTQIILKVADACISIYDTVWLYQFATTSSIQLLTDVSSGCVPLTVNFETPTLIYSNAQPCEASWDFGDGTNLVQSFNNTNITLKAKHIYPNAGVYQAKVEVKFKNSVVACNTFTAAVEALLIPQITLSIVPKKITLPNTQCTATITTTNADSVVIDWGDGYSLDLNLNLNLITQTHDYADTGHYIVKATAYNKNTCYTEVNSSVYHADTFMCFIPNAFSPNRDATNETFKPVVSFCKSYELTIYNRWGEVVYETNYIAGKAPQPAWSGDGNPSDTYIYMFTAKDGDNLNYSFKGTVMLIR